MKYFAIFVILMKKKDISSIFKNNVHKSDIKFTNWIIKKETNKNEDRNSLPGLSLLSRRGRERERDEEHEVFFWVTLLKLRLVAETRGVGAVAWWRLRHRKAEYERERDAEFLTFELRERLRERFWNLISKWKRRRGWLLKYSWVKWYFENMRCVPF